MANIPNETAPTVLRFITSVITSHDPPGSMASSQISAAVGERRSQSLDYAAANFREAAFQKNKKHFEKWQLSLFESIFEQGLDLNLNRLLFHCDYYDSIWLRRWLIFRKKTTLNLRGHLIHYNPTADDCSGVRLTGPGGATFRIDWCRHLLLLMGPYSRTASF